MPARVEPTASRPTAAPAAKSDFKDAKVGTNHGDRSLEYTVKSGDTLNRIAKQFGTDVETLFGGNGHILTDKNKIKTGDVLVLPTAFYVVQKGDTYSKIGRELGIDAKKLMALNGAKSDALKVGQELVVPAVLAPERSKVRAELKALVDDFAAAEGKLFFGPGSFTTGVHGNSFWTSGPVESGKTYEFAHDFGSVKVWDNSSDGTEPRIPLKDTDAFRQLLIGDVMAGVVHSRVHKMGEERPREAAQWKVLEGPTMKGQTIGWKLTEPGHKDVRLSYDAATGKLTLQRGTAAAQVVDAGKRPSEVADALAKLFAMKLPLYGV